MTRNDLGPRSTSAERKRQQRARDAQRALLFERADWSLFLSPATLPQKAGCQPSDLRALVLREIVDNALDAGASATLHEEGGGRYVPHRLNQIARRLAGRTAPHPEAGEPLLCLRNAPRYYVYNGGIYPAAAGLPARRRYHISVVVGRRPHP